MRQIALLTLVLAALAGCAAGIKPARYGTFSASTEHDKKVADDVVKKLVALYPPARSRFDLQHPTKDRFGSSLTAALRTKGYALQEYQALAAQSAPVTADAAGRHTLAYVFDQPAGTDLYRVTLVIDNASLSRVYQVADGTLAPAGTWVRKE
jgi:hypothetical protein